MKKIILSALLATTLVLAGCNKEPQNKKIDPNPLINEFIKTTNVSEVPNLPIREDWSYQVDAENKVFTLSLSSLDAPTIETNFLSSVEAADWACINESKDYLLEDVGYAYIDDIEEPEVLLLFKASSDQFTLKVKLDFVYEPAVDINLVIAEYVKNSYFSFPKLPEGPKYNAVELAEDSEFGKCLLVSAEENDALGASSISVLLDNILKEDREWISFNDAQYPVEEVGYMYGIGYEFDSIQVSFFSDAELFTLAIYVFGNDYVAANKAVAEYVKSTGFSVPSLLDGHLYFAEEVTDDVGYTYFQVACLDDGTPAVDALDAAYLDVVTQDGSWVCVNDEEYTYEIAGYIYDIGDENNGLEIQFYTYEGFFILNVYVVTPAPDPGPEADINDVISEFTSLYGYSVPALPDGYSYAYDIVDDEEGYYLIAYCVDNGTPGVDALEDYYAAEVKKDPTFICENDEEHTVEEYGYMYYAGDDTQGIEIQFYTYQGYFQLIITPYFEEAHDIDSPTTDLRTEATAGTWDASEQVLIDEYLFGIDIPCLRVEDNTPLCLEEEYLVVSDAHVDGTVLDLYQQALVDAGWEFIEEYEFVRYFEKSVVDSEGVTHYITIQLYAYVIKDGYVEPSEEGYFCLVAFDPYIYSMPDELINEIFLAYSDGKISGTIPAIPHFSLGEIDISYLDLYYYLIGLGYFSIYAYNVDSITLEEMVDAYNANLTAAGYSTLTLINDPEYGDFYESNSADGSISIQVSYDANIDVFLFEVFFGVIEEEVMGPSTYFEDTKYGTLFEVDFTTMENEQVFEGLSEGVVSISVDNGTNNNGPKYYDSGTALRFYASNSITITLEEGYSISALQISLVEAKTISFEDITSDSGTIILEEGSLTISFDSNTNSVTITFGSGNSGHIKVASIMMLFTALE